MLKNYFKVAFRSLFRNKGFSLINISGLAIGMASAMLIMVWIYNEWSYDRFFSQTDRIYQVFNREKLNGSMQVFDNTPSIMATTLKIESPELQDVTRFSNVTFLVTAGEKHLNLLGSFADSSFLRIFDFPLLKGDRQQSLNGGYNIVLTEQLAQKLFGQEDPIGKIVRIDSNANFTVSAVLKALPANTAFDFEYILPWSFRKRLNWDSDDWGSNSVSTYVLLKPGAARAAFDNRIRNIAGRHSKEPTQSFSQPLSKVHLYSKPENGQLVAGRVATLRLFSTIAAFILLIACINFMNLSTARSEKRAREVGIRKVVGAYRGSLIAQFMGESILLAILAFLLALLLVQLSLPAFDRLMGKELNVDYSSPSFWLFSASFILLTGILAGSYPALYLSSFQPVKVLKGAFKKSEAPIRPRQVLVILQFSFAIILIISTIVIWQQIQFAEARDSGYNRNNLIYTFTQGDASRNYPLIKQELLSSGAALSVTKSANPITRSWGGGWGYSWDGSTETDTKTRFIEMGSDADFAKTLGVQILEGRDIDVYQHPGDTTAVLLNEAAIRAMHLKDPVGKIMRREGEPNRHIVGIVKDFIIESPFDRQVNPIMVSGPLYFFQVIHIKLNPANTASTDLALAEKIFRKYNPQYPFESYFADEYYARKFKDEQRVGQLSALFAGLTILISCLGLFSLATYMAENRIKEIGVRKVLGASVTSITTLLAKDFVRLVVIAFLIASPIAWVIMDKWLGGYGYRTSISWAVFAAAGGLAVLISILTVSYQSIRAALQNPVRSLRSE